MDCYPKLLLINISELKISKIIPINIYYLTYKKEQQIVNRMRKMLILAFQLGIHQNRLKEKLKLRISYQLEIPSKVSQKKYVKFDGIYFEGEKYCLELEFQDKIANIRQYYNYINISIFIKSTVNFYKACVSKRNNGQLVKTLLKLKWWWLVEENYKDNFNFLWESSRNDNFIITMPYQEQDNNYNCNVSEQQGDQDILLNDILMENCFLKIHKLNEFI
ncbi:unnamed protein product (macronuclear) [Paramecium tetraurelia]|uniref:Ig-like domain-containing protein n=1 Tax=Paramecium tetraurelia TaxID=5888 RepID=A0DKK2_PARTE|nr:uncharacterized protein GSPATT00017899001 [Paramecium tetraurelia]CAK83569.1 unnamed protein product [Paramecium tetraurelia]|eukprot:XP_001450966.1 hypothetical protein (macronuclear) [Paramecium tetraurelia strain d4-2]